MMGILGVLYYRIVDPYRASYGVEHPHFAIAQLAQTTMRAEIGRLTLDRTLAERTALNTFIVTAINEAANAWGIECLRYEVRDIHLPQSVVDAMHSQVSAERSKRAAILESEGKRQAAINIAEGSKQADILESEARKRSSINHAEGISAAIELEATATSMAIQKVAKGIAEGDGSGSFGQDAIALQIAEKWVQAWGGIAKNAGSVVVVPSGMGDAASMVTQGLSIFKSIASYTKGGQLNEAKIDRPLGNISTAQSWSPTAASNSNNDVTKGVFEINEEIFGGKRE
jgi:regulator of protease activity HflC (stomatin/prohibitin superfamily)